jgi:hypothetical protein
LRDLSFPSVPRPSADGTPTSYPVQVAAGQLLDLKTVPEAHRRSLTEGTDFKTDWNFEEQEALLKSEEAAYLKQFEAEQPEVPAGGWRNK